VQLQPFCASETCGWSRGSAPFSRSITVHSANQ